MKRIFFLLSILWTASGIEAQTVINGSIMHDDLERDYILYIPDSYAPGSPLVMNFHGYSSNAFEQMFYGDFQALSDQHGFLLVHPDGTEDITGTTHWNVGWGFSSVDDVGFISDLIDTLHAAYTIDLDRVYSTGMSNGGFFSYYLACNLSERIAAIASVTGAMSVGDFDICSPSHPMPVMEIHGTADPTVAYDGTFAFEGSEDIVNYWAAFNDILAPPLITPVPDTDPDDGCTAERWLFEGGTNGSTVEHYKIFDGGHTWPGADFIIGTTNQDFDASEVIWEFFSQYDINGLIIVDELEEQSQDLLKIWPNPAQDRLHIAPVDHFLAYRIVDARGRTVLQSSLSADDPVIDIAALGEGNYLLVMNDGRSISFMVD